MKLWAFLCLRDVSFEQYYVYGKTAKNCITENNRYNLYIKKYQQKSLTFCYTDNLYPTITGLNVFSVIVMKIILMTFINDLMNTIYENVKYHCYPIKLIKVIFFYFF